MRMWMTDPAKMCRQHLLGEHVELHMFVGAMDKGTSMRGYADRGMIEMESIYQRHEDLVAEMERRGYKHDSPMDQQEIEDLIRWNPYRWAAVNQMAARAELCRRCPACASLHGA